MNVLSHLTEMMNHPNVKPGSQLSLTVTLVSGEKIIGNLHALLDDGLAVMAATRIYYVPLSGLASVDLDHPIYGPPP